MALSSLSMFSYRSRYNLFNHNKSGFTITEVLVSALIIAILAAGLFSVFLGTKRLLNYARHRVQAYNFATEALDKLRSNYNYTSDPQMNLANDHLESELGLLLLRGELAACSCTLKYDVIDTGVTGNGYKQVTIKVHWDEPL